MDLTVAALVISTILAGVVLGMIIMAILLHPYRKALKRTRGELSRVRAREAERRLLQRQLGDLDR